jgi:bifunctional UDP-N-acetylglucosamine pyrophosphorylase/glucosamine-1-phosphate N-acetyltransferase
MNVIAVILAAGQGTRMRSSLPKVMHPLLGRPLVQYGVEAARIVTGRDPVVVIGHGAEAVRAHLGEAVVFALQAQQLGTGHAVLQAEAAAAGADLVLATYADMPLLTVETLNRIIATQRNAPAALTMLTVEAADPRGFGRVVRSPDGRVTAIVEEAQATPDQLRIRELNSGVYCFQADWLWPALKRVPLSTKGEYYLTDLVGLAVADGLNVNAVVAEDEEELLGVNTRVHLSEAAAVLQRRINREWMLAGVTLIDPSTTYIEPGVRIGQDTVIWPNTHLQGRTTIGEGCEIGPNTIMRDAQIGAGCRVIASMLEEAVMEDDVQIGPFGHLRKGAYLSQGVHMGNFGEVKNSRLGPGVKMGHFSYIGDATIGAEVNIGAGTITCNFGLDGKKSRTEVGDGAFIGSDTMLIAPIKVGAGAATGTGSVVNKDVPPDTLVVGVPARAIRKLEKRA